MAKAGEQSPEPASVQQLQGAVARFVSQRDWEQFHAPRDLAIAISVEAAELLDLFKWSADSDGLTKLMPGLQDEIADVMIYCLSLCNQLGLDASAIVEAKLAKNNEKYPVERYKGRWR
jgi:NTP pyrophosphatase (non-canonical NTP hydrolase)